MKLLRYLLILMVFVVIFSLTTVLAENLDSSNYTLKDPELGSIVGESSTTNYSTLSLAGSGIDYSQVSSSLYKIGSGQAYTFMANVPTISCFETDTDSGSTSCTGLPNSNGMVGECGAQGCYDRAMVQLNASNNPSDTLYLIEVSLNDWATIYIVDGSTHTLKPLSSKTINDYKTISAWTTTPWNGTNIRGLRPNTTYKVRARALQGDFTESPAGPSLTATTAVTYGVFDLDIGNAFTDENDAPYSVDLGTINSESYTFTSSSSIIVEFSTNAQNGASVYVKDLYSGLRSASTLYLLDSSSEDLSLTTSGDGFGLQSNSVTEDVGSVGKTVFSSTYSLSGTNVGQVQSGNDTRILCSLTSSIESCQTGTPTWILGGQAIIDIGARASIDAPAVSDYQDTLTFTFVGSW